MSLGSSKEGYGDGVTELTFTMLLNQKYIYIYIMQQFLKLSYSYYK